MKYNYLLNLMLLLVAFGSCRKSELAEQKFSALKILGEDAVCDLVSITADKQGGFVIGANTWVKGNKDFWVLRYDANFNLIWERKVGSLANETLQKVYIDKSNNILLAGVRTDFGLDTFQGMDKLYELPYYHYLDGNGNSLWQLSKKFTEITIGGSGQNCTNLGEDTDGALLITASLYEQYKVKDIPFSQPYGHLIKISKEGKVLDFYASPVDSYDGLFVLPDAYGVFYASRSNTTGGVTLFDKNGPSGYDEFAEKVESIPDNGGKLNAPNKFSLIIGDRMLMYYAYNSAILRVEFNASNRSEVHDQQFKVFENISTINRTLDETIILATNEGLVYETDEDFKMLNSFKIDFKVTSMAKLNNGDLILGYEKEDRIYLVNTNTKGEFKQYD